MGKDDESKTKTKTACCIVGFVFIFILLIAAIVYMNYNSFDCFTDVMGAAGDNMKNKIMGGKHYNAINSNEDVVSKMNEIDKNGKVGLIAILADWCGYCKQLKDSGTLREISKQVPVIVLTDQHKQTAEIMKKVKAGGFPALIIYGRGRFELYEGPRDAMNILTKLR